jgi:hypothetical protein
VIAAAFGACQNVNGTDLLRMATTSREAFWGVASRIALNSVESFRLHAQRLIGVASGTQTFTPDPVYAPIEHKRVDGASAKRPDFKVIQPTTTYTGAPIEPIQKGLPEITRVALPRMRQGIRADIFADKGKVVMGKNCTEHGTFRDSFSPRSSST